MAEFAGRCLCGAVRWECDAPALWMGHCHCGSCRRQSGAGVVSWIGLPVEAFRWTGEAPGVFESSPGAARRFCGTCGSPVAFEHARWPGEVHVYAAQLTEGTYRPRAHFHHGERVEWLELADDLRRHDAAGG